MIVLGLINFIAYVDTNIKGISRYSKICRNPIKWSFPSIRLNNNSLKKILIVPKYSVKQRYFIT